MSGRGTQWCGLGAEGPRIGLSDAGDLFQPMIQGFCDPCKCPRPAWMALGQPGMVGGVPWKQDELRGPCSPNHSRFCDFLFCSCQDEQLWCPQGQRQENKIDLSSQPQALILPMFYLRFSMEFLPRMSRICPCCISQKRMTVISTRSTKLHFC